ncbi:MAG: mycothiol system anti-sigma-R factor [Acidimicrobiales bacterium]
MSCESYGGRVTGREDHGVDCEATIERLYHFLDGELTDDRRLAIERHLDECAPCVSAYGFEIELRQVIANRCKDHVPDSLIARVRRVLGEADAEVAGGSGAAELEDASDIPGSADSGH